MDTPVRILVADDQADVLEALRLLLKGAGYKIETADSPQAVLRVMGTVTPDLILMDMNYARDTTSGQEGLDLLAALQSRPDHPPIVVMTAWGSVDLAVEAMQHGANDFVQKPWDNRKLLAVIAKQVQEGRARTDATRRAKSELEIARSVQQRLFPHVTANLRTAEYAGRCVPASEVGGD